MSEAKMLSPAQLRGGLAMLNISQAELAERAGISVETLKRLLGVRAGISVGQGVSAEAMEKARAALEKAGVEFIAENGGGPGVRLRKTVAAAANASTIAIEDLNAENDK
jgi:transcriptional regulator with XRE-family HTH domain